MDEQHQWYHQGYGLQSGSDWTHCDNLTRHKINYKTQVGLEGSGLMTWLDLTMS